MIRIAHSIIAQAIIQTMGTLPSISTLTLILIFILAIIMVVTQSKQFPKILWKYWDSGTESYPLADAFDEHHRFIAKGWSVRTLNKTTVHDYLKSIPYYAGDLDTLPYQTIQHKSDYIRLLLLSYYGGVWIDQSAIFVQDLSWLDNLRNNTDVVNKHWEQPQVFFFTFPQYGSKKLYLNQSTNQSYELFPGYQMWFMAAQPNSAFIKLFLQELHKGILNNMHSYELGPKYMQPLIQSQHVELGWLADNYYLSSLQLLQYLLQKKQNQLDHVAQSSNVKQLAVWYYKIWHIKSQKGPFAILNRWKVQQTDILARYSMQQLRSQYNISIRYFVKVIGSDRAILQLYYFGIDRGNGHLDDKIDKVKNLNVNYVQKFFCPEMYSIYTPSILYQYLVKNSSHKFDAKLIDSNFNPFVTQCSQLRTFVEQLKSQPIINANTNTNPQQNTNPMPIHNANANNNARYQSQRLDGGILQDYLKRQKSLMEKQDKLKNQRQMIQKQKLLIEKYKKDKEQQEKIAANKSIKEKSSIKSPGQQKQQKIHKNSTIQPKNQQIPIPKFTLPSLTDYTNLSSEQLNFVLLTIIVLLLLLIIVIILMCKCRNHNSTKLSNQRKNRGIDLVEEEIADSERLQK